MSLGLLFGVVASLFAVGRLWFVFRGSSRVDRATIDPLPWAIWAVLTVLTLAPQLHAVGWRWTMLLLVANLAVNVAVFLLSLRHDKQPLKPADWLAIVIAAISIVLWVWLDEAAYAVLFSLTADFVGVCRTWRKSWCRPGSEVLANWLFAVLASASATLSAYFQGQKVFDAEGIASWYPAYAVGNALVTVAILMGRRAILRRRMLATAMNEV